MIAVGLAASLLTACGSGEPRPVAEAGPRSEAPDEQPSADARTTVQDPAGKTSSPATDGDGPEVPVGGSAPTPPPPPAPEPGPGAPGSAEGPSRYVPAPGDYVYDVTGHVETTGIGGGREPVPPVSVDTVTVRGPVDRQEMTIATRNGDEGTSQELDVVVTRDDARLTRLSYRPGGEGVAYDVRPEPPPTIARFPYRSGDRWEIAWRDAATGIAGTGNGTVSGPETVTTPLGVHETVVVTVRQRLRGTMSGTLVVTSWLDPRAGTVVKQHVVTDFDDATGASHAESTRVLRQRPS